MNILPPHRPKLREPKRVLTLSCVARRIPCRKQALIRITRAGLLVPDFATDAGHQLFLPARLARIRRLIANR